MRAKELVYGYGIDMVRRMKVMELKLMIVRMMRM